MLRYKRPGTGRAAPQSALEECGEGEEAGGIAGVEGAGREKGRRQ